MNKPTWATCSHYGDRCSLGFYGGYPWPQACRRCTSYRGPWRGAGDAVRSLVRLLFLGRLDIAERLAGCVEALWEARRRKVSVSLPVAQSRPCGCKARQRALNDLLPFGK